MTKGETELIAFAKETISKAIPGAYRKHKRQAKVRGKGFKLSLEQWTKIWENALGPYWFVKRGRGKTKFCMARIGDKGPYKVGNVKIVTCSQNNREQTQNPKWRKANSLAQTGKKASAETRRKLSAILMGHERHTPQSRAAISAKLKGRVFSPATIKKMSESAKRRKPNNFRGRHSKATRAKISAARAGVPWSAKRRAACR